jgi:hypothetical protein
LTKTIIFHTSINMSTFWRTENKIPIVQTSSAITAENGLEFGENQIIRLDIPKSTKFIQPKESYLKFDFKINLPAGEAPTRLQLDGKLGAQSIIKNLRIYSSAESGAVLLEEILDYNAMVGVKYSYDGDDTVKNKRALTEGGTVWCPTNRGTLGNMKSNMMDTATNPYFKRPVLTAGNSRTTWSATDMLTVKCCLPLHSGIWSSERVYPNLLTGLRVEIELEEAKKVLKQLDSVLEYNKLSANAVFDSVNGSGSSGGNAKNNWDAAAGGDDVDATEEFYVKLENSCLDPSHIGLVVGEKINFVNRDPTVAKPTFTQGGAVDFMTITEINASANASGGAGLLMIKVNAITTITSTDPISNTDNAWLVVSKSVAIPTASDYAATYTVSNVEMVVQELDMGSQYESDMLRKMSEGGMIGFDILSVQNYKHSSLASDIVMNMRLPIQNSRCRSIVCLPTDSTVYAAKDLITGNGTYDVGGQFGTAFTSNGDGDWRTNSTNSGLVGISDYLTNYNFFYDGKLQPSRAVSTAKISSKYSIDAMPLIENEKALTQAGIAVRSMADFNKNFGCMRAFSLNRGVEDLRNKDFSLQLNYQGTAPTKNKMWNNYVFHLRQIQIRSGDIAVIV